MPNVLIRQLSLEDSSISFRWRNDPEVWRYTGKRPDKTITEEIEKKWLAGVLQEINSHRFAIIADDQYVGNIQITDIVKGVKGQYHIFIGEKSFWSKGVALQATAQILRFAKEKLDLKEIYLIVDPSHITAIKLYERCGFRRLNEEILMSISLCNTKPPDVSVFVITFNHDSFISKAMEGIIRQKTNFDFDIVVGEDCSSDGTRKKILKYADTNPGKFHLLLHENNIGASANQIAILHACTGKYIAICEGDDYWTDPYKLQKQVDFLENHTEYSLTCHLVDILNEETKEVTPFAKDYIIDNKNRDITINDFLDPFLIKSCSLVFRRSAFDIENRKRPFFKDITLFADLLSKGKGILLNECMGVYRLHGGGVWSNSSSLMRCKANAYTLIEMNKHYNYKIEHIKTNASLQILDYLNLLIAEKKKNFAEIGKIFLILLIRYRKDVGDKMLLKMLKRILKSFV